MLAVFGSRSTLPDRLNHVCNRTGLPIYRATFAGDTAVPVQEGVKADLISADWTLRNDLMAFGYTIGTFTGNLNTGWWVDVGGPSGPIRYYLRSAINNQTPYEVQVGVTTAATCANLIAAIDGGPGSGTLYCAATVANPDTKQPTSATRSLKSN